MVEFYSELHRKKNTVHTWFDKLWRNHEERDQYYKKLAVEMGMTDEECHFSLMNSEQLDKALIIIKKWWWEKYDR